jgi:hypothetical protein
MGWRELVTKDIIIRTLHDSSNCSQIPVQSKGLEMLCSVAIDLESFNPPQSSNVLEAKSHGTNHLSIESEPFLLIANVLHRPNVFSDRVP